MKCDYQILRLAEEPMEDNISRVMEDTMSKCQGAGDTQIAQDLHLDLEPMGMVLAIPHIYFSVKTVQGVRLFSDAHIIIRRRIVTHMGEGIQGSAPALILFQRLYLAKIFHLNRHQWVEKTN